MIKMVFFWKDRADLPPEECEARYRAVHMDLARRAFKGVEGFRALTYNRVRKSFVNDFNQPEMREVDKDWDAYVELWFDSREQLQAAASRPEFADLFADHPNWMAVDSEANIRVYDVEETVFNGERPSAGEFVPEPA